MKELTRKLKEKSVGADASVRPFFKRIPKNNKGITLIALIITIIVMLILVSVTVTFTIGENGILSQAKDAKVKQEKATEKDTLSIEAIACYDYQTKQIDMEKLKESTVLKDWGFLGVLCKSPEGNLFKVEENGTVIEYELDDVEKYLVGEDGNGIDISKKIDINTFQFDDPELIFIREYGDEKNNDIAVVKKDNVIYEIYYEVENTSTGVKLSSKGLAAARYETKGREGTTVKYSIDGTTQNEKDWLVLYDDGTNMEIICLEEGRETDIGDEEQDYPYAKGETKKERILDTYENLIDYLNKQCADMVTNENKVSVRCLGSDPVKNGKESNSRYRSDDLETSGYNGKLKDEDKNYESDLRRLKYFINMQDSNLGRNFVLASRGKKEAGNLLFGPRFIRSVGEKPNVGQVISISSNGEVYFFSNELTVCPIVKIPSSYGL